MSLLHRHSVLITGANRGIGLGFVKEFCALGQSKVSYIIATCRKPNQATELHALAKQYDNLSILKLDIKDYQYYDEFYNQLSSILGDKGLNMLINNAGIFAPKTFEEVTREQMLEHFETNAVAPLLLSQKLLPLLKLSSSQNKARTLIVNISDNFGSDYAYQLSKTALSQISKSMSVDLLKYNIKTVAVNPGWVLTDMGGPDSLIDVQKSVLGMLGFLLDETVDVNGKFFNYDSTVIPWFK